MLILELAEFVLRLEDVRIDVPGYSNKVIEAILELEDVRTNLRSVSSNMSDVILVLRDVCINFTKVYIKVEGYLYKLKFVNWRYPRICGGKSFRTRDANTREVCINRGYFRTGV